MATKSRPTMMKRARERARAEKQKEKAARRLERAVPQMRDKGRIRAGADADITVFDADRIIDRATWEKPAEFSEGIRHVLVNGVFVVRDARFTGAGSPGVAIRRPRSTP